MAATPPSQTPSAQGPASVPALTASEVDKGHGRLEKRTIRVTRILTKQQDFRGLKQGFELIRERTENGVTTTQVVHGITSLSAEQADATRLLHETRGHWAIENGLHYRRDVTLGEDASRIRKGTAPQIMAALRNAVMHQLDELKAPSLAAAIRTMNNCFSKLLDLFQIPPLK